ncbi:unnamed protein product, partial [Ceratitis capitata]
LHTAGGKTHACAPSLLHSYPPIATLIATLAPSYSSSSSATDRVSAPSSKAISNNTKNNHLRMTLAALYAARRQMAGLAGWLGWQSLKL